MRSQTDGEALNFQYETNPSTDDIHVLTKGITDYAMLKKNQSPIESFAFFARKDGEIKAGCNGVIYYGCLYIDQLWVDSRYRDKNVGTKLIQLTEKLAKDRHCTFITVNTMDWEALGFYQKQGFVIEFERGGYANESIFYALRKDI